MSAHTTTWSHIGKSWVATINGVDAAITETDGGPLGPMFSVEVGGKTIGSYGGGERSSALARAKVAAEAAATIEPGKFAGLAGAAHTPTPWEQEPADGREVPISYCVQLSAAGWGKFALVVVRTDLGDSAEGRANAAFILRACNAHDALIAAGEAQEIASAAALSASEACPDGQQIPKLIADEVNALFARAEKMRRAALALAKEGAA